MQGCSSVQPVSQSASQPASLEIARPVAPLSFPLRGILSPWFINSACALFPTAALLQSKEVGLLSIQIFSFVSMFSRRGRVRLAHVCVQGCARCRVFCLFMCNRISIVIHPLIVACVCNPIVSVTFQPEVVCVCMITDTVLNSR